MSSRRLHQLVAVLSDEQVPAALDDVRRRVGFRPRHPWPPAWFGMTKERRTDAAARVDETLAEGFGRSA
jgi:hypothetical protein